MLTQGFAVGVTQQGCAVVHIVRRALTIVFSLGQQGEPAAEGITVDSVMQAEEVRCAISYIVRYIEAGAQRNPSRLETAAAKHEFDIARLHPSAQRYQGRITLQADRFHGCAMRVADLSVQFPKRPASR